MRPWVYLGIAVVIGVLAGAVLWQRNSITALSAQVTAEQEKVRQAAQVNESQQKTIERITAIRANDDKVLSDLTAKLSAISQRQEQVRSSIQKLERGNNAVREYLSTPVPAELAKLLNQSAHVRGNTNPGKPASISAKPAVPNRAR